MEQPTKNTKLWDVLIGKSNDENALLTSQPGVATIDKKKISNMRIRDGDARVMLMAAERLGKSKPHADATELALLAMSAVARSSLEAASLFVVEEAAAVVLEISAVHRSKVAVQTAAVQFLGAISTPNVYYLGLST
jgi:hypothetical protein